MRKIITKDVDSDGVTYIGKPNEIWVDYSGVIRVGDGSTPGGITTSGSDVAWGILTGTITDQTDLVEELNKKAPHENGFPNRSDSIITFDDSTRTFSIQPTGTEFEFYVQSLKIISTGDTIQIPDTEGLHVVYYDTDGNLQLGSAVTPEIIQLFALVSVIYWDADNKESIIFGDERHGSTMDSMVHSYNHLTFGARYESGFAVTNIITDGNGDLPESAQIGLADGAFWDEDIRHQIVDGSPQTLRPAGHFPVFYRSGPLGLWRRLPTTDFPIYREPGEFARYNQFTGTTWQTTEMGSADCAIVHLFATSDIRHPIIAVMGQNVYDNVAEAREGIPNELFILAFGSLVTLSPEFIPILSAIYQTQTGLDNAVKARFRSLEDGDFVDWLNARNLNITGSGTSLWGSIGGVITSQTDLVNSFVRGTNLAVQTIDATPTALVQLGTEPNLLDVQEDSAKLFKVSVSAIEQATGATFAYETQGLIKNISGTTAIVGLTDSPLIINDVGASAWLVAILADDINNRIEIQVTGEAGKIIDWSGKITTSRT